MTAPSHLASSLLVAIGGGIGAWLRFATGLLWLRALGPARSVAFPWATMTCNVAGSLAMGVLVGWLARHGNDGRWPAETWRLFIGVGVLGGYTTFSSFSLEFALLVERGQLGLAAVYVALSLAAGFLGLFAGLWLMRSMA